MDTNTRSIAFYQGLGFEICGQGQLNWSGVKEEFKGMVVMKKLLQ